MEHFLLSKFYGQRHLVCAPGQERLLPSSLVPSYNLSPMRYAFFFLTGLDGNIATAASKLPCGKIVGVGG